MSNDKLPTLTQIKQWMCQIAQENGIPGQVSNTWSHSGVNFQYADAIACDLIQRGHAVDRKFLKVACYLHDIGRMITGSKATRELVDPVYHAFAGYRLLKRKGYGERIARVCIVHMAGSGLDAQTNKKYGFKNKDYFPRSIEEKLLAYADARNTWSRKRGSYIGSFAQADKRFRRYGSGVARLHAIHHELGMLTDYSLERLKP